MKRIVFVIPPPQEQVAKRTLKFHRKFPPLSDLICANLLRAQNWSVEILDLHANPNLNRADVLARSRSADVVVLTTNPYADWQCPSLDLESVTALAHELQHPSLMLTGNHGTHYPRALLEDLKARVVIRAEPESVICDIAQALIEKSALSHISNISFRENDQVFHNPAAALPALDELPSPAYDLVNLSHYQYELLGDNFALLEAARGCPFSCNFCNRSMFQNKYRKKSVEKFLHEVDELVALGCQSLYVFDLEFTINKPLVKKFCQHLIDKKYKLRWACQTRADSVDSEILPLMKQSGCRLIHFGVESGDEEILKSTNKRIDRASIAEGVRITEAAGISTAGFFILGHPGERHENFDRTLKFAAELDLTYASFHPLLAFPGSPLFEQKFGKGPYWDQPIPRGLTYFTPDEENMVLYYVQKAYRQYFLRRKTIVRALMHGDPRLYYRQLRLFLSFLKPTLRKRRPQTKVA